MAVAMNDLIKTYNSELIDVIEHLNLNRTYTLKNNNLQLVAFDINSLLYISINDFIYLIEDIIQISVMPSAVQWLETRIYVENVSNFIPNIKYAVCTNFLDGRLFLEIKEYLIAHGGQPISMKRNEKPLFDLDDTELYKKILEDDDFLSKQVKSTQSAQLKSMDSLSMDPYTTIVNSMTQKNPFQTNQVSLNSQKLFKGETRFHDLFGLGMNTASTKIIDMKDFHNKQKALIAKGLIKPFTKPRGKQMELTDNSDRPFLCKVPGCNRAFKRFEHLKRHNKMHTGEKPYQCKYPGCNRGFSRSDNLNAHYKTHNISPKQIRQLNMKNPTAGNINFDVF